MTCSILPQCPPRLQPGPAGDLGFPSRFCASRGTRKRSTETAFPRKPAHPASLKMEQDWGIWPTTIFRSETQGENEAKAPHVTLAAFWRRLRTMPLFRGISWLFRVCARRQPARMIAARRRWRGDSLKPCDATPQSNRLGDCRRAQLSCTARVARDRRCRHHFT